MIAEVMKPYSVVVVGRGKGKRFGSLVRGIIGGDYQERIAKCWPMGEKMILRSRRGFRKVELQNFRRSPTRTSSTTLIFCGLHQRPAQLSKTTTKRHLISAKLRPLKRDRPDSCKCNVDTSKPLLSVSSCSMDLSSPLTQDARPDYFQPKVVQLYELLFLHVRLNLVLRSETLD